MRIIKWKVTRILRVTILVDRLGIDRMVNYNTNVKNMFFMGFMYGIQLRDKTHILCGLEIRQKLKLKR